MTVRKNSGAQGPHQVVMFAYPDAQILDITGPLEIFGRAGRWLRDHGMTQELAYQIEIVARNAGPLITSSGLQLLVTRSFRDVRCADTLLVTGGIGFRTACKDRELIDWLRTMSDEVSRIGSICTGAMILAETGLLAGRAATTHWAYCEELAANEAVGKVNPDAIFVREGKVYTSAGVTSGMDMALAMVEEDWGQAVALEVARELVMFLKRPGGQSQFSHQLAAQFSEGDRLHALQLWMLDNVHADLSVEQLAKKAHMSIRHFARRFTTALGITPGRYVEQIRLEAARRKLEEANLTVEKVAALCGFGSTESMRRVFIRYLGIPPREYRERFKSPALD